MKNYLKKFDVRPSTFQEKCPRISEGIFEQLSSTDKYFRDKCAWLSRGTNFFRETFALTSIFLPISVLGCRGLETFLKNFTLDPELFEKSVLGIVERKYFEKISSSRLYF